MAHTAPRKSPAGSDRHHRRVGKAWAVVCVVLLATTAAACGGGSTPARRLHTTPTPRPGATQTAAAGGAIELQKLRIERPVGEAHVVGDDAGLYVTIVNRPPRADQLTAVTSPDATKVVLRDNASSPTRPVDLRIAPRATISMQHPDGTHLELSGLTREIQRGMVVPVTFTFEQGGTVTVNVPVTVAAHPTVPSPSTSRSPG